MAVPDLPKGSSLCRDQRGPSHQLEASRGPCLKISCPGSKDSSGASRQKQQSSTRVFALSIPDSPSKKVRHGSEWSKMCFESSAMLAPFGE